jgi:hypothetical protein
MTKKKMILATMTLAVTLVTGLALTRDASAGTCQLGPSSTWETTLTACGRAQIWGTIRTLNYSGVVVHHKILNAWLKGITGSGYQSAQGRGVKSSGALSSTCFVVDDVFNLYPTASPVGNCDTSVKFYAVNTY